MSFLFADTVSTLNMRLCNAMLVSFVILATGEFGADDVVCAKALQKSLIAHAKGICYTQDACAHASVCTGVGEVVMNPTMTSYGMR